MRRIPMLTVMVCSAMMTIARAAEPESAAGAALEFCQGLKNGLPDLKPGGETAISSAVEHKKRDAIRKRLERLAMDLTGKDLCAGACEVDGDLAVVMIEALVPWEPSNAQLLGLAMVRSGGEWKPAPVPGSFENTMIPATSEIRRRTARLEFWLLSRQSSGLQSLIDREWGVLKTRLAAAIPLDSRRDLAPTVVVERFLASCLAKDRLEMLAWCEPETDWREIENWVSTRAEAADWQWVLAPETPRSFIQVDADTETDAVVRLCGYRLGSMDKAVSGDVERLLEFTLRRAGRKSPWFLVPPPVRDGGPDWKPVPSSDKEIFARALIERVALVPSDGKTPEDSLLHALSDQTPMQLLGMIRAPVGPRVVDQALQAWAAFRGARAPVVLDRYECEGFKAWLLIPFDPRQPARSKPVFLSMSSQAHHLWQLVGSEATSPEVRDWVSEAMKNAGEKWLSLLLKEASVLPLDELALTSPSETQVKGAIGRWHECLRRKAPLELSAQAALLPGDAPGHRLCDGLASSFRDMESSNPEPTLESIHDRPPFVIAVVAYRNDSGNLRRRLVLMTQTAGRIRILLEMNFVLGGGRSADFLNRAQLRRLGAYSKEAVAGVTAVFNAESVGERD